MERRIEVDVPYPVEHTAEVLADLGSYPRWITGVSESTSLGDDRWAVVLSARIGPFTRSKKLTMRMTETQSGDARTIDCIRDEGPGHGQWHVHYSVAPSVQGSEVNAVLHYEGRWWVPDQLGRVLEGMITSARTGLVEELNRRAVR